MSHSRYDHDAGALIQNRLATLRTLTFAEAIDLPDAEGEDTLVAGKPCAVTTFAQRVGSKQVIVTVQVARRAGVGFVTLHTERGLVFESDGSIREATREELLRSGG
jgi:hypothetical protein